jgi:hypothetical protein
MIFDLLKPASRRWSMKIEHRLLMATARSRQTDLGPPTIMKIPAYIAVLCTKYLTRVAELASKP